MKMLASLRAKGREALDQYNVRVRDLPGLALFQFGSGLVLKLEAHALAHYYVAGQIGVAAAILAGMIIPIWWHRHMHIELWIIMWALGCATTCWLDEILPRWFDPPAA